MPRVLLQLHEIALSRVTLGMPALLSARLCLARFLLRPTPLRPRSANANYSTMRRNLFRCTNERNGPDEFLRWVANLSDEDLVQLHRYDSTLDVASVPAELNPCPQCGRTFRGVKGARHALSKQARCSGASHSRSDMSEVPGKTFSTRSNMVYHYHHHCSQRDTPPSDPSTHQWHPATPPEPRSSQSRLVGAKAKGAVESGVWQRF